MSLTPTFSKGTTKVGSPMHFFNKDTWNTGSATLQVNLAHRLLYQSLPFLPNLIAPFIGEIFRYTQSSIPNSSSLLLTPTYNLCLLLAVLYLSLINWTFSIVSWTNSSSIKATSPILNHPMGDLHFLQLNTSNGAIWMLEW